MTTITVPQSITTDIRSIFDKASSTARQTISATNVTQLDGPTPCSDFDVRHLLGHLLEVLERLTALGNGTDPMMIDVNFDHITDSEWLAAWTQRAHIATAAWADDAVLDRTMVLPWATETGAAMLAQYTNEVVVHTWDLAVATGQKPAWDDDVLAVAFHAIQHGLPAGNRAAAFAEFVTALPPDMPAMGAPFAEAQAIDPAAPLIDRLVAWNGRNPAMLQTSQR